MNKIIKDERTIQLNNKIQSETFNLVMVLLGVSVFVKAYILNITVSNCITELAVMLIAVIYLIVRGSIIGYNTTDTSKHGNILKIMIVFALSMIVTIFHGLRNFTLYGDNYTGIFDGKFIAVLVVSFISSLVFISLILGAVYSIEKLGQKRLEKKLEDDED